MDLGEILIESDQHVRDLFLKVYSIKDVYRFCCESAGISLSSPSLSSLQLKINQGVGYKDKNYIMEIIGEEGLPSQTLVFKIMEQEEGLESHLQMQFATMDHLSSSLPPFLSLSSSLNTRTSPLVIPLKRKEKEREKEEEEMKEKEREKRERKEYVLFREKERSLVGFCLTFVGGDLLSSVSSKIQGKEGITMMHELGKYIGLLSYSLSSLKFDFSQAEMKNEWYPHSMEKELVSLLPELPKESASLVQRYLDFYQKDFKGKENFLRKSLIHGDLNENNITVLTKEGNALQFGIFDFGDSSFSYLVGEIAIAAAYAGMLCDTDPLRYIIPIIVGFHSTNPLQEAEIDSLFYFITLRICLSISMSIVNSKKDPQNEYLTVNLLSAKRTLESLRPIEPNLFKYFLRAEVFGSVSASCTALSSHLDAKKHEFGLILERDYRADGNAIVFDFSDIISRGPEKDEEEEREERERIEREIKGEEGKDLKLGEERESLIRMNSDWGHWIFGQLKKRGGNVGIGRYRENRNIYEGDQFGIGTAEKRTVHLGIDLFVPAGEKVLCPYPATVHSFCNNDIAYDYGPCIILEHVMEGLHFFTLYGHLSLSSLHPSRIWEGKKIERGETVGYIGGIRVNGHWAPHVHFQIIFDMLGEKGNFVGVSELSRESSWGQLCPDPNKILQIPKEAFLTLSKRGFLPSSPFSLSPSLSLPLFPSLSPSRPLPLFSSPFLSHSFLSSSLYESERERVEREREKFLSSCYSLSYSEDPILMACARGSFMFDAQGRSYLDLVNNICHVGHSHPSITRAISSQADKLNTNTRYLYPHLTALSSSLLSTFPSPLSVAFFVCSGSEANELALRLARCYTKKKDIISVDMGYHGNTNTLVSLSPYKFSRGGGSGPAPYVHVAETPDTYRGKEREKEKGGQFYASDVEKIIEKIQSRPKEEPISNGQCQLEDGLCCFISESILGCAGQIVLPPNYLKNVYSLVRKGGGVCIADEVQVGFGRVGSHMWAFQTQDVVPDIVVLGKPMGNGHPIAAVVTTPEIAQSLSNGMEYFNSFGGNPVSCAVAKEVLDIIEREQLQKRAFVVGEFFLNALSSLQKKHQAIGEVRGMGLFLGVDLVIDPISRKPATNLAKRVVERMKEVGVLISRDGPFENVLKIKPPLSISLADAARAVALLDDTLRILSL